MIYYPFYNTLFYLLVYTVYLTILGFTLSGISPGPNEVLLSLIHTPKCDAGGISSQKLPYSPLKHSHSAV